jgi:hypothetical protein
MWAFLELTLDQAGSAALRHYLDAKPSVALAAATLLARAGEGDTVAQRMIDALRYERGGECELRAADQWRVAEVIAEYCSVVHLQAVIDAGDISPNIRLAATAAGWRRYRDGAMAVQAGQLLAFCEFDVERECDIAILQRALVVPGIAQRPPLISSVPAILAAMCVPSQDVQACAAWVHALRDDAAKTPTLRAYAQAAVLFAEPFAPLDADLVLSLLQGAALNDAALAALVGGLGNARRLDILDRASADVSVPLAARFASTLAWLVREGGETPRMRTAQLLVQLRGTSQWDSCVVSLGVAGQVGIAADECMHVLTKLSAQGGAKEIRYLMDMGCSSHITQVVRAGGINPVVAQFAVRCLAQLGNAPSLDEVARDTRVPAAVRLHALKMLIELGWIQETLDQVLAIAQEIGEPSGSRIEALEGIAMTREIVSGTWPPAVRVEMAEATKNYFPIWSKCLLDLLAQPGVSGEDAVSILSVLGHGQVSLELVLLRCLEQPGDGMPLRSLSIFASDEGNFGVALRALGALCGDEDEGDPQPDATWMLHRCAALIAFPKSANDDERAQMLEWVAERAGRIWLGLLHAGVLKEAELVQSLEALAVTEQQKFGAQQMLMDLALDKAAAQPVSPELWATMVPYALALERIGDATGAAEVAYVPFKQGAGFSLANGDCITLVLQLARYKSAALVKGELRMIALHTELPMTVRIEAATALARKLGGKKNQKLLAMLQA